METILYTGRIPSRLFCWWLVDVPYWFKASFSPKSLGILSTLGEIGTFMRGEI